LNSPNEFKSILNAVFIAQLMSRAGTSIIDGHRGRVSFAHR
jgi:hypothetical protein